MGTRLSGRKIAIAVGDFSLRVSLARILELEGAIVSDCADAQGLRTKADETPWDLWIVDCWLPGVPSGGLEVILPRCRAPILLISADPLQRSCGGSGMHPALGVPFRRQELISRLLALLEGQDRGGRAARGL